ncbi:MAG TPA: ABC transporter substrate-binding protein [Chloroflexota bacterium]|nr:ABC transporter substrate-binding protein [Chloroflexota bacterium]
MRFARMRLWLVALVGALALTACRPDAAPPAPARASQPAQPDGGAGAQPTAPAATTPAPRPQLKLTYPSSSVASLPIFAARDGGFFERNGLDVETLLLTSDRAMAAVASGEIHYVGGVGPASVAATALGLPLRAVWVTASSPAYTVFARPDIRTVDELRGKRIGVPAIGGTAAVVTGMALKHYGLEMGRDVTVTQLEGDALITESLRSGVIDAAPLGAPFSLTVRQEGFTPLVDVAALVQMPQGGLSATVQKLTQDRDEVRRVVRALEQAQQWVLQQPDDAITMIQTTLNTDRAVAQGTYEELVPTYQGKGLVTREGIDNILQAVRDEGRIGADVRYEDVADGSIAEEVARELGLIQ